MYDSHLKPENLKKAIHWYDSQEFKRDDPLSCEPWFRFWNEDLLQVDGDLTLEELKELVKLMEGFKED